MYKLTSLTLVLLIHLAIMCVVAKAKIHRHHATSEFLIDFSFTNKSFVNYARDCSVRKKKIKENKSQQEN